MAMICRGIPALQASGGGTYEWNPAIFVSDPRPRTRWRSPGHHDVHRHGDERLRLRGKRFGADRSPLCRSRWFADPLWDDRAVDLNGLLGGGQDPGGSWTDPDGAAHGNVFDPQVDPGGAYIHVVPGAGACPTIRPRSW